LSLSVPVHMESSREPAVAMGRSGGCDGRGSLVDAALGRVYTSASMAAG